VQGAVDPMQRPGCRKFERAAALVWTTSPTAVSDDAVCALQAGKTYWLIVSPTNPQDGLQAGEHSCKDVPSTDNGCDVGAVTQSSVAR
jgi:hypothetical protein